VARKAAQLLKSRYGVDRVHFLVGANRSWGRDKTIGIS
jgi:hypothetical protein